MIAELYSDEGLGYGFNCKFVDRKRGEKEA